jgi:hypothetical protein
MSLYVAVPNALHAPSRLNRSQLRDKMGTRRQTYPRAAGVLVPRPLVAICRDAHVDPGAHIASFDGRMKAGRDVVQAVSRALRHIPDEILDLEMPHPSIVLASFTLEDRTRNALERLLPILAKEPRWSVGRYLAIPKFGARCLVDLLAAWEESSF